MYTNCRLTYKQERVNTLGLVVYNLKSSIHLYGFEYILISLN
jgi:hypothetical protein